MVILLLVTFIIQVTMTYLLADFYGLTLTGISDVNKSDAAKTFTTNCWKDYIDTWGQCVGRDYIDGNKEHSDDWGKEYPPYNEASCSGGGK